MSNPDRRLLFPFSNDRWSRETVNALDAAVAAQRPSSQRTAGIVVGSGGLPPAGPHLGNLDEVYIVALHPEAVSAIRGRIEPLPRYSDWDMYRDAVKARLSAEDVAKYDMEWSATEALRTDFSRTRDFVAQTAFYGWPGDIRETAPRLFEKLAAEETVVSFVNFTNTASYLGSLLVGSGRRQLRAVLDIDVMTPDAIIVDSAPTRVPALYSLDDYGVAWDALGY